MSESSNLQRDQQGIAEPEAMAGALIDARLKDLHTAFPAIVVSFNPAKQTCVVQPAIQRVFDGVPTNLPVCVDCPVQFPRGGGYVLTFPIKPGDEVLVVISERCIDNWYAQGGTNPPAEYRMHDLSDGFVIPGVANQGRNIPGLLTTGVELRNTAGGVRVRIDDAGAITQQTAGASTVLSADGKFTINAPGGLFVNGNQTNSAAVTVAGITTLNAALVATASAAVTGTLTNNGKNVGSTHIHKETKPGAVGEFSGIPN